LHLIKAIFLTKWLLRRADRLSQEEFAAMLPTSNEQVIHRPLVDRIKGKLG